MNKGIKNDESINLFCFLYIYWQLTLQINIDRKIFSLYQC